MSRLEKVQIAGGGVAGLAAGVELRQRGVEVEIHERYDRLQGRATGFSIWAYAIKRLLEWGFARERLDAIGREIVESHIVDDRDRPLLTLPIRAASEKVGAPSMDVDRRLLQEALIETVGRERYRFGSEVVGVRAEAGRVGLELAGGDCAWGDLALGGDGIHSVVRDRALGQTVDLERSRYAVIEGIADLDPDRLPAGHHKQVWGRRARFGVGWVGDGRARWFLIGRAIALADDPELTRDDLLDRCAGLPEIVAETVAATADDQIVRTDVRHGYPPERWHGDRVVLLGDAAHTLSPFAGMGACSTIEDVAHLVRILGEHDELPGALAAFQADREGDVTRIEKTGRRNEVMMMPSNPLLYWGRNALFSHTPDAKLVEIAEGMTSGEG